MDQRKKEIYDSSGRRIRCVYICFLMLAMVFVGRIVYIQFLCRDTVGVNSRKMTENIIRGDTLHAHRGTIFASDGRPLAISVVRYRIRMDVGSEGCDSAARFFTEARRLSDRLEKFFTSRGEDQSSDHFYGLLCSGYGKRMVIDTTRVLTDTIRAKRKLYLRIWEKLTGKHGLGDGDSIATRFASRRRHTRLRLFRDVDINEWDELSQFPILNNSLGTVYIKEPVDTRVYPQQGLALRTIGRIEVEKPYGIEHAYRDSLAGRNGYEYLQNVAPGLNVRINNRRKYRTLEPVDGCNIHTTIDIDVQAVADRALRKQMAETDGIWGTSIVMETSTGNILSMVNLDRNSRWELFEGVNHAVGTRFEPGSTIKLATAIALLDGAGIPVSTTYDSGHGTRQSIGPYKVIVSDAGDDGGIIDMTTAFSRSANVYFAKAVFDAFGSNPQRYVDILKSLHLNERLDLGLLTGKDPIFKEYKGKGWSAYSLIKLSYGYEIEVTPLRIITLYNAVANGGVMVAPRLVTSMSRDGRQVVEYPTRILSEAICSERTLGIVRMFMENVADNGTARMYFGPDVNPFRAAAKTGTAQFTQKASIGDEHYVGSMITYFPADNPKYTIYTAIHKKARKGSTYYGAGVAGPVQQEIARFLYGRCTALAERVEHLEKGYDPYCMKGGCAWAQRYLSGEFSVSASGIETEWCTTQTGLRPAEDVRFDVVPDVGGMGLKDALFILEKAGMKVVHHGSGSVCSQNPEPGSTLPDNRRIKIELR